MAAGFGESLAASTEGSTAAPDTPVSSDCSAPSGGGGCGGRGGALAAAAGKRGMRPGAPGAPGFRAEDAAGVRALAPLHRRAADAPGAGAGAPPAARGRLGRQPQEPSGEARGTSPPRDARSPPRAGPRPGARPQPRPAGAGAPRREAAGAAPGAARSPARSPTRSPARSPAGSRAGSPKPGGRSLSPAASAGRIGGAYSMREQMDTLAQQKVLLEWQVEEASRSQAALEQALSEERSRGAADREKLLALAARLEHLENSRGASSRTVDDNRSLHSEIEAQQRQLQELRQQMQFLQRHSMGDSPGVPDSIREENARLRHDLQQSRDMLAKYTGELASIMPSMQRLLLDLHPERGRCRSPEADEVSLLESPPLPCSTDGNLDVDWSVGMGMSPEREAAPQTPPLIPAMANFPEPAPRCPELELPAPPLGLEGPTRAAPQRGAGTAHLGPGGPQAGGPTAGGGRAPAARWLLPAGARAGRPRSPPGRAARAGAGPAPGRAASPPGAAGARPGRHCA